MFFKKKEEKIIDENEILNINEDNKDILSTNENEKNTLDTDKNTSDINDKDILNTDETLEINKDNKDILNTDGNTLNENEKDILDDSKTNEDPPKLQETNEEDEEINTSNIFEEFDGDSNLKEEVKNTTKSENKDIFYYIHGIGSLIQTLFWILLITLIFTYLYIFIQENETINKSHILDPICFIFLGDIENKDSICSSLSYLNKEYESELEGLKKQYGSEIISILEQLYKLENFSKTKEIVFLEGKTESKLKILKILEQFDKIKNDFEPMEKDKIKCHNIEINNQNIFKTKCEAFSTGYESGIKGFNGTNDTPIKGTSISVASSFLNFIEKKSDAFTLLDKQKTFSSQNIIGENTGFTNKTMFYLKLKYNPNNLSL